MDERDKRTINQSLSSLVNVTQFDTVLENKLLEKGIFSDNMLEGLRGGTEVDHKRNLYVNVQRRGPAAFRKLVDALVETKNLAAAKLLDCSLDLGEIELEEKDYKVWNPPNYLQGGGDTLVLVPPEIDNPTKPLEIKVKKLEKGQQIISKQLTYCMESKPRGYALIIDNEDFHNEVLPTRTGSMVDANNLDILLDQLKFKVTLRRNLPYYEMMSEVQKFAAKEELKDVDMTVVAILSHGRHGLVAASDGRELETEWVLRQFNNQGCPELRGKPKFFILQACRGDEADYGVLAAPITQFPSSNTSSDAKPLPNPKEQPLEQGKEITWEDMLVAYATLPGYVANRDRYRGTWFIESICSVFMEMAAERDLRDMLDIVAQRLKNYESEFGTKQTFTYEVRHFYKKLYFNPY